MTDKKQAPTLQGSLEYLREITSHRKDYYKFVIGLSTGTLVFSVTFIEKFNVFQVHKPIILVGWVCLIISIICGVWLLAQQDWSEVQVNQIITVLSNPQEAILGTVPHAAKVLTDGIIDGVLDSLNHTQPNGEEALDKLKEALKALPNKTTLLKDFLNIIVSTGQQTNPSLALLLGEMIKEGEAWAQFLSKYSKSVPEMSRRFRKTTVAISYVEKTMMWAFYAGIILITVFSAINFYSSGAKR